ncbi:HK97-gp10 family putative phage morphogenesis protein [Cycloclasticus pugetii]|uniref:HK97-gp10 family putative phage morphogenesis protein n=1 Tax=Cycloclasticus pugetii TaxID=34068 RepID=UPI003A8E6722
MASDGISYEMTGLPELLGKLDGLEYDIKRKGGRFALRRAAQVLEAQAKANAARIDDPTTGRNIADNIAIRWSGRTFKKTGNMMFRLGVLTGSTKNLEPGNPDTGSGGATPHAMLVELGTKFTPAQPYLRPVIDQAGQQAVDEFVTQYSKKIDRVLKAAKKKGAGK